MADKQITRRKFVRDSLVGAAGIAAGLGAADRVAAAKPRKPRKKILNYNPDMEYRRLGKTGLWISAVCMGGHWKRVNKILEATGKTFDENCHDIVSRCIEVGINYIDACSGGEVKAYSKALTGRREKMYLALAAGGVRSPENRTANKLLARLDKLLKESNQEYTDIWRIICLEPGGRHTFDTA